MVEESSEDEQPVKKNSKQKQKQQEKKKKSKSTAIIQVKKSKDEKQKWDDSTLMELIKYQNSKENWAVTDKILKVLGIQMENLKKEMPSTLASKASNRMDVWLTILILECLQEFYARKKKSWNIIQTKALHWLETQSITFAQFNDRAKSLLTK